MIIPTNNWVLLKGCPKQLESSKISLPPGMQVSNIQQRYDFKSYTITAVGENSKFSIGDVIVVDDKMTNEFIINGENYGIAIQENHIIAYFNNKSINHFTF